MKSFPSVTAPSEQTATGCRAADCSLKKEGGTKSVSNAQKGRGRALMKVSKNQNLMTVVSLFECCQPLSNHKTYILMKQIC